jgi:hypothetical protein
MMTRPRDTQVQTPKASLESRLVAVTEVSAAVPALGGKDLVIF